MRKKKLTLIILLMLAALVVAGAVAGWVGLNLQPVEPQSTETVKFVINKGEALSQTGNKLAQAGLIKQPVVFRYYVQLEKLDKKIQAGSYELSPSMSLPQIARTLTEGTEDLWITIPEGWRKEEIALYLANQNLTEFDQDEFMSLAASSEGKLFPDTYLIPRESSASQIHSLLTGTFDRKVLVLLEADTRAVLTADELLVLASIVEREGRGLEDMRRIAGILLYRMKIGMPLQTDATLQYLRGKDATGKWWAPPNVNLKQTDSPYNTYLYPGLPPAPIANPGLDAIKAVLDPVDSNDLFYIHTPSGQVYYARTLEEHNANINKYLR